MMRMMYLISLFFIFSCKSQKIEYDTVCKKNITYVTFEINSKNLYPVRMSAFFDIYNVNNFNKSDADLFVKSFYKNGIYTPSLIKGYKKMLNFSYDSISSNSHINKNEEVLSKIMERIDSQNGDTIILNSGDKIILKKVNMSGCFFNVDKSNNRIFTNSMEWDILSIEEIKKVFIPFDKFKIE
jgi:hypothetical protein